MFSDRFGANWACSTGSCSGVTIQFEQYETSVDYLSQTTDDQNNRAGDVIAISLLDPESGNKNVNICSAFSSSFTFSRTHVPYFSLYFHSNGLLNPVNERSWFGERGIPM